MSRSLPTSPAPGRGPRFALPFTAPRRRRRSRLTIGLGLLAVALSLPLLALNVPIVGAASTGVNLDQWASTDNAWQNGNLNGNNSRYPEGGIVPFRLAMEGLAVGSHSIHINYDFTASGHKAYDFLATWDVTNAKGKACAKSGGGVSSKCPSLGTASSYPFPTDNYKANGLSVHGAEAYSAAPRRLTIWGGTITSISGPTHSGSPDGNSTADFVVTFKAARPAVLLAWGGHLAQSAYWDRSKGGASDGAAMVSGAPWHMRTLQLDGSGNKNQDRSIQPSAIVGELPPFALAPPTPAPPAPAPPAPRPTTPPSNPGNPGPPGGGGSNPGPPAGPRGGPATTLPPTSTAAGAGMARAEGIAPAVVAGLVVLGLAAMLGARREARDRGRGRGRRRERRRTA